MPQIQSDEEIDAALLENSDWNLEEGKLHARFTFVDFKMAMEFMNQVAVLAEALNHHPKWTNSWNLVEISLCTHDAGNKITDLDFELAAGISATAVKVAGS